MTCWRPAPARSSAWPLCTARVGLPRFSKETEQRLAGAAQAVVHPLAAAVGLDEPGDLEPREVGRDGGGAEAELPGQLCGGAGHRKLLEDGGPSSAEGGVERRP